MLDPLTVFDASGPFDEPLTDDALLAVETILGHRLPAAYVDLCRRHNGGRLARTAHPAPARTSWAQDHVGVDLLYAISQTAEYGVAGEFGSEYMRHEWEWPDLGVYVALTPAAGYEAIALDYRTPGEPAVVHVDGDRDNQITLLAPDFETFILGLVPESDYPEIP